MELCTPIVIMLLAIIGLSLYNLYYILISNKHKDNIINEFEKCDSCTNGFDGANGNGYQPCGCGDNQEITPPLED